MQELLALLAAGYAVLVRAVSNGVRVHVQEAGPTGAPLPLGRDLVVQRDTLPAAMAAVLEELGVQLPAGTLGSLDAERIGQALGGHRIWIDALTARCEAIEKRIDTGERQISRLSNVADDHARHLSNLIHLPAPVEDPHSVHEAHTKDDSALWPKGNRPELGLSPVEQAAALALIRAFCPEAGISIEEKHADYDDDSKLNWLCGYCPAAYDYAVGQVLAARGPVGDDTLAMLSAPKVVEGAVEPEETCPRITVNGTRCTRWPGHEGRHTVAGVHWYTGSPTTDGGSILAAPDDDNEPDADAPQDTAEYLTQLHERANPAPRAVA